MLQQLRYPCYAPVHINYSQRNTEYMTILYFYHNLSGISY